MQKRGLSLPQASKYVKEHGFYNSLVYSNIPDSYNGRYKVETKSTKRWATTNI